MATGGIELNEISELYEKKISCNVCGEEFVTSKVRTSKLRMVKRDADFMTYYEGENPLLYNVFVCPHCGYAAMEEKFTHINFSEKKMIKNTITPKWNKRDFSGKRTVSDGIEVYKLALITGEVLDYKSYDLANICLRICWLNRMADDEDEEKRFAILARDLYKYSYTNESINMEETALAYLIGELSRRMGEKGEALSWYNTALQNPSVKNNAALENMIREQWQIAKEG